METGMQLTPEAEAPLPPTQTPVVNKRACRACNRRKTKCDREHPTCHCCRRAKSSCEYPTNRVQSQRNLTSVVHDISRLIELLAQTPATAKDTTTEIELPRTAPSPNTVFENPPSTGFSENPNIHLQWTEYTPDVFIDLPSSLEELSVTSLQLPFEDIVCADATMDSPPTIQASIFIESSSAMQLLDIFFDHVQSWMPILHRPRFTRICKQRLATGDNALSALDSETAFLLCSIFALAIRFGPPTLTGVQPFVNKEEYFAMQAKRLCLEVQDRAIYGLKTLQGSVMLSYYSFTSGEFSQAWIRAGFCVRLAQELGLCELDTDAGRWRQNMDWVHMEERRRAWWLIWDLDTVVSIMSRRPFAIDRRFNPVLLPVTDEAWFAEVESASARIISTREDSWTSLQACGNRSSYAWYLVSRYLMSLMHDGVLGCDNPLNEQRTFTHEIMCLRLLLPVPSEFYSVSEGFIAESNWISFAHLVLASTLATFSTDTNTAFGNITAHRAEQKFAILDILSRWPSHHMACASPLAACTLMPVCMSSEKQSASSFDMLSKSILSRVMSQFAERCKLGSLLLGNSEPSWPISAPAQYQDSESTVNTL